MQYYRNKRRVFDSGLYRILDKLRLDSALLGIGGCRSSKQLTIRSSELGNYDNTLDA